MAKVTYRYKDKKLPKNQEIIDKTSGEVIANAGNIFRRESTGKINMDYEEYVYLELKSLRSVLSNGIKQVELGLLITLCTNLMHEENICMQDNGEPHTTSSIASLIDHSPQSTKAKLNRLIEMNLLDHSKAKYGFKEKKVFRINPHIIKKGRHLNAKLPQLFNDVSKSTSPQSSLKNSKLNKPKK
jgi:hypothetical protein